MGTTIARRAMRGCWIGILCAQVLQGQAAVADDPFEQPPIRYSDATPDNRVSRLQAAIERDGLRLRHDSKFGYLPDLLERLDVAADSQMLVFSKTSLQRDRIAPRRPRALYFNDEVYVGYCQGGDVLEIAAADPQLGAVFYSLDQGREAGPAIARETQSCLQCHVRTQVDDIPGFTVRSVFADTGGLPLLAEGGQLVDHTTPIEKRWGGWYVTGTHGTQAHLGNLVVRDPEAPKPWSNEDGQNVTDLAGRLKTDRYLTPHSDIVALLVFEHQTYVQNLLTKASFTARQALHYEAAFNKALGDPEGRQLESTTRRIEGAGDKLVRGLLFVDEAPIAGPIAGTSGYAQSFSRRGPRDHRGRSLRDFDLTTRLFKYPCSYLIHTRQFDDLPPRMKHHVAKRLRAVLDGRGGKEYEHLAAADRRAISEILAETKPDLWKLADDRSGGESGE
jgi:hypothetical protein